MTHAPPSLMQRYSSRITHIIAMVSVLSGAQPAHAQSAIPIAELQPATASSRATFGAILGIHHLSNNNVLVNDAKRRQVSLCDATLANCNVVIDSIAATPNSYPEYQSPLIRYLGDSSLLVDLSSKSLLLIDAIGSIRHPMALPNEPNAAQSLLIAGSSTDPQGRLVYRQDPPTEVFVVRDPVAANSRVNLKQPGEFAAVMRADLDARRVDSVARVRVNPDSLALTMTPDGRPNVKQIINPLPTFDEWAMLSNGTVAIIRGQDYHVDWIHADGKVSSTPKLAFDWKALTIDDKQHLADSALAARQKSADEQRLARMATAAASGRPPPPAGRGGPGGNSPSGATPEIVPFKNIADYYPPIRREAAIADLDDNLWILPTTSAQSRAGELVYDVVNEKNELYTRVRLPLGRSIAGFGKGGIVYLAHGTMSSGFVLERAQLPR